MEIEIPFGAFDSELMHQEISIPEGFEAVIEGNKIILKKIEPEDERIREYLIRYIDNTMKSSELKSKLLAWLEKQGESYTKKDVDDAYLKGISDAKNELEKQGEQKPQRMISAEAKEAMYGKPAYAWSEKDEKEYKYALKFVDNILNNCGNKKDYDHCKRCYDWLKNLKERIGGNS